MATATLVTSEQFQALPDRFDASGNRIKEELIGGEIVPMAATSKRHDIVKNNAGDLLRAYLLAHTDVGLRSLIEIAFEVTEEDTFVADVSVVRVERLSEPGRVMKRAPEIAIEVVSPSDTANDIQRKVNAYLAHGAHSVWIFFDDVSVMMHTADQVRAIKNGQVLEDPLLPGFSAPVSAFFAV